MDRRQLQQNSPGTIRSLGQRKVCKQCPVNLVEQARGHVNVAVSKTHQLPELSRGVTSTGRVVKYTRANGYRAQTPLLGFVNRGQRCFVEQPRSTRPVRPRERLFNDNSIEHHRPSLPMTTATASIATVG
jgi:hypothetical protein